MRGWWDDLMEEYGGFIRLYFIVLVAIFGAFCIGMLILA